MTLHDFYYLDSDVVHSKRTRRQLSSNTVAVPKSLRDALGRSRIPVSSIKAYLKYGAQIAVETSEDPREHFSYDNETDTLTRSSTGKTIKYYSVKLPKILRKLTGKTEMSRLLLSWWVHTGTQADPGTVRWTSSKKLHQVPQGFSGAYSLNKESKKDGLPRGVYRSGSTYYAKLKDLRRTGFATPEEAYDAYCDMRENEYGKLEAEHLVYECYGRRDRRAMSEYLRSGNLRKYRRKRYGNVGSKQSLCL